MKFNKIIYREKYKKKYLNFHENHISEVKSNKKPLFAIKNIHPPSYDIKKYQKTPIVEFTPAKLDIFLNHKIIILDTDECEKYLDVLHNYKNSLNNIKIN